MRGGRGDRSGSDVLPAAHLIGVVVTGNDSPLPQTTDGLEISQHLKGRFVALFPDLCLSYLIGK